MDSTASSELGKLISTGLIGSTYDTYLPSHFGGPSAAQGILQGRPLVGVRTVLFQRVA